MLNWPSYIAQYHLPKHDATTSGRGGGGVKLHSFSLRCWLKKCVITLLDYCAIWWLGYSLCDILKVHVPWLICVLLFTLLPHVILMNDRHEKLGTDSHSFGVAWGNK